MRFDIITSLPEIFGSAFSAGILKKGIERGLIEIMIHNLRDYALDIHGQIDDKPFGGGEGMVLKPEPLFRAVESIPKREDNLIILLTPQGKKFNNEIAKKLAKLQQIILICGRYEGVDERVREHLIDKEISIGDYVLSGGEFAALVIIDAVSRFIPGVVGKISSVKSNSFTSGLLDFPHYTRPREFQGMKVPEVLLSGDHAKISKWRRQKAIEKTFLKRPDLLDTKKLTDEDKKFLNQIKKKYKKKEGENGLS